MFGSAIIDSCKDSGIVIKSMLNFPLILFYCLQAVHGGESSVSRD